MPAFQNNDALTPKKEISFTHCVGPAVRPRNSCCFGKPSGTVFAVNLRNLFATSLQHLSALSLSLSDISGYIVCSSRVHLSAHPTLQSLCTTSLCLFFSVQSFLAPEAVPDAIRSFVSIIRTTALLAVQSTCAIPRHLSGDLTRNPLPCLQ